METKIVKLKNGYTDFDLNLYNTTILTGARGIGKSYPVAKWIEAALTADKNAKFLYVRNTREELSTYRGWCNPIDWHKIMPGCASHQIIRGKSIRGVLTLEGYAKDGKLLTSRDIGKVVSLENSASIKSDNFDNTCGIVFEEYNRINMTVSNERSYIVNFLELLETTYRRRPPKIFLIANNTRSMPLLEKTVSKLPIFGTKCLYKIFRKSTLSKIDVYMAYLNGEPLDSPIEILPRYYAKLFAYKEYGIYSHFITRDLLFRKLTPEKLPELTHQDIVLQLTNFIKNFNTISIDFLNQKDRYFFSNNYRNLSIQITDFLLNATSKQIFT